MIFVIELACLLTASFFAGMETGLLSADKLKIFSKKERNIIWAWSAHFLLEKPERLLGTTLIGTNVAVVTSTVVLNNYLRERYSITIAVMGSLFLAVVYLLFSEIIPKTFFRRYADTITVKLTPLLRVFFYLFFPVSFIMNGIVRTLLFFLGQRKDKGLMPHSRNDFRLLMHLSSRESGFGYDDFRMIDGILDFSSTLASEVMVPLHQVSLYDRKTREAELIGEADLTGQRFYPVYRDRADNIIGYIDIEDLSGNRDSPLNRILREPVFVPEVKPLAALLADMVKNSWDLVFLCDEYGTISGVVTHTMIGAEIMGDVPGFAHPEREDIIPLDKDKFIVSGNTELPYLNHILAIELKRGSNQTLGGYLCEKMGVIPQRGDVWVEQNVRFVITQADRLHIRKVQIELLTGPKKTESLVPP